MAANSSISLSIGAQDRFSKTLSALEGRINKLAAPVKRFQNNVNRLSNFGPAQLARGMSGVSKSALSAARSLGTIVPVLGAITGGASLAGIYRLSSAWAQFGQQVGISARAMGMGPEKLQKMQAAAQMAGGSAEGMSAALQGLAQTRFNIRAGLDPAALAQFQQFGITFDELKKDAPDKLFERIANRLRSIRDPVAQAAAASKIFGGGAAGILPILQQSSGEYQRNIALAGRYGVLNQKGVRAATELAQSQSRLELAVRGFGNAVAESVAPILTPVVTKMADWIAANRRWIATDIAKHVQALVRWFSDGGWQRITKWASDFVDRANSIAHALGGWKNVAIGSVAAIGLVFAAPVLAGLAGLLLAVIKIRKELRGVGVDAASAGEGIGKMGSSRGGGFGTTGAQLGWFAAIVSDMIWPLVKDTKGGKWLTDQKDDAMQQRIAESHYMERTHSLTDSGFDYNKERAIMSGDDPDKLTNRAYNPNEGFDQRIYGVLQRSVNPNSTSARAIRSALQRNGFNDNQVAGILANWSQESGLQTSANNGSHAGLAQWDKGRQEQFRRRYGHAITAGSIDEQVDFFSSDLKKVPAAQRALSSARTAEEAGFAMGRHYEIPGITDATLRPNVNARAHAAGDWARALAAPTAAPQRVEITIAHSNAPAGSSVRVNHASPGVSVTGVKTHRAMDPAASSL